MAPAARAILRSPALEPLHPLLRKARAVARPGGPIVSRRSARHLRRPLGKPLTVVSANLWHDWPQHRRQRERLQQVARLLETESVDVALLQEVSRRSELRSDEWLAERLGMGYAYARANGDENAIGFEEGVAIYSRFPLRRVDLHHLGSGTTPFSRRLALAADIATPYGTVSAFSVHLGLLPWHNANQVDRLLAWVAAWTKGKYPALIGGDFNAGEDSPQVGRAQARWLDLFRNRYPQQDGTTHELYWPWGAPAVQRRLDYLFLAANGRPWRTLDVQHVAFPERHSDHHLVLAHLQPQMTHHWALAPN